MVRACISGRPARLALICSCVCLPGLTLASPIFQPPGSSLTWGEVSHGQVAGSATGNPAAAAAASDAGLRKTALGVSASAGLEYGNLQELFDKIDELARSFRPSDPGDIEEPPPGQDPDKPDDGIDLGDIWDNLDPDVREAVDAIARDLAIRTALLGIVRNEGFAKAWLAADVPLVIGREFLGGTWTVGMNWSGASKTFGIAEPVEFDPDEAREKIDDWLNQLPIERPDWLDVGEDVSLRILPESGSIRMVLRNDSSLVSKSTQTTQVSAGYSRGAWSNDRGTLYLGAKGHVYLMRLSRLSVRFGDITDSKELFDEIRDADFRSDTRVGLDVGALWVSGNYQVGLQWDNINEPEFSFPDVELSPYSSPDIVAFLQRDKTYQMDSQLKIEGSIFSSDRRWSAHLGYDLDPARDATGDRYQWLTLSAGLITDRWWLPGLRVGYRKNVVGTQVGFLSLGLTAFKYINFDISSALDTVRIDGDDLPQGLMASVGFDFAW